MLKTHCKRDHEFTDENTYVSPGGQRLCRTCRAMHSKAKNDSTTAEARRAAQLRLRYDLTPEQFDAMVEAQQGLCAVCNEEPGSRGLFVDHCHSTNKVRGLLCTNCNVALGMAEDSVDRLMALAAYLLERA